MKTSLKILMLLCAINFLIGCNPLEAYISANCPSTDTKTTYNTENTTNPDSSLPTTKRAVKNSKSVAQNDGPESEFLLSYSVGVGTQIPISETFSFKPRVLVTGKGNKTMEAGFEDKLTTTYIDVPLLVSYKVGESNFNINAGLQPSVLLSANRKITGNGNEESQKVTDQFNTFDLGATIGVGYIFDNGIGLNLGYDHGITNINKSSEFGSSFKAYNRVLHVGVSYAFMK